MKPDEVGRMSAAVVAEVEKAVIGKRRVIEMVLASIVCGGHVLFEDYPGLAKTMLAKSVSGALGCSFRRIQFTSDLMPADITGTFVLNRSTGGFELRKGPIFTNILLADEINRAPPKTQSALLEAMQERQTTLEGESHPLPAPFVVLATQNPIEYEGTYPLPEAQIDRFFVRLSVGYPDKAQEVEILKRRRERKKDDVDIAKVLDTTKVLEMQRAVEDVHMDPGLGDYAVEIVRRTRAHGQVEVGASPRGSLAVMRLSSALAALAGRDFVIPDDIKAAAVPALAHRVILKPDPWIKGVRPETVIGNVLDEVPVPKVK
ncbi:MAG: MoxR family ATPase [Euryarchaeota archaeon]|nr:MoxR family ATPase [Euryarchaeota archaeon]